MINKNNVVMAELVMRNVAVSLSQMLKKENRICRAKLAKRIPEHIALESGREAVIERRRIRLLLSRLPDCSRHFASLHGQTSKLFSQLVKGGQNFFAMAHWVNIGIDLRHSAL